MLVPGSPGHWPALLATGLALAYTAFQWLWLPATPAIDISGMVAETLICLIPLTGLLIVQHLRHHPRVYWPCWWACPPCCCYPNLQAPHH